MTIFQRSPGPQADPIAGSFSLSPEVIHYAASVSQLLSQLLLAGDRDAYTEDAVEEAELDHHDAGPQGWERMEGPRRGGAALIAVL